MTADWSAYRTLRITREGRILTIALDRPPLNAVNAEMHEELAAVFRDAEADAGSDVVVLTGAGEGFSGGGDLQELRDAHADGRIRMDRRDAKRIIFSLLDMEKAIIARVNGHAVGLGATLAVFCADQENIMKHTLAELIDDLDGYGLSVTDSAAVAARLRELQLEGATVFPHEPPDSKAHKCICAGCGNEHQIVENENEEES